MDPAGNLRKDIEAALLRQNLTTWQRAFLTDIHARLERSGGQVRLSDKQWQKIFEILERQNNVIALPPAVGSSYRYRPAATKSFRPRFGRAARRLKWHLRNVAMGFLVVAAVAVGQHVFEFGRGQFQSAPVTMLTSQT